MKEAINSMESIQDDWEFAVHQFIEGRDARPLAIAGHDWYQHFVKHSPPRAVVRMYPVTDKTRALFAQYFNTYEPVTNDLPGKTFFAKGCQLRIIEVFCVRKRSPGERACIEATCEVVSLQISKP